MTTQNEAMVLVRYGNAEQAFERQAVPMPEYGPDDVLIKTEMFGLNFANVLARRDMYPDAPPLPAILGYDVCGTVEAIGSGVEHVKPGDRVIAVGKFGGYGKYFATTKNGVAHWPEEMDAALGTTVPTQGATAYYCIHEATRVRPGEIALVHAAAGGVGLQMVQLLKSLGCTVIGTASGSKHVMLKEAGCDLCIDYRTQDFVSVAKRFLGRDRRVDVVFDSLGGSTFRKGVKLMGAGGRMVTFGVAGAMRSKAATNGIGKLAVLKTMWDSRLVNPMLLMAASKSIVGVNMLRVAEHQQLLYRDVIKLMAKKVIDGEVKPPVDSVYHVDDIAAAHAHLESRQSRGKIAIAWEK